jgi:signal peptide peptidase SppA
MKIDRFWAGTDEALAEYMLFIRANAKEAYGFQAEPQGSESSRLLDKQGTVGVISIAGSLTNGDRGYGSYMTTYSEIREALVQASADPQIKTILLDIKSGGGSVQGLSDTADLVRKVDTKVKPVHAFSDSAMASAAYWLGSSARKVHASNMAEIGSIGVLAVHREYTKMLEQDGITPTVIRSGAYKALGNPYEKLSDKGEQVIQDQLDHMAGIFDNYIADRRGMTVDAFKKKAGEGRVFVGQQGVEAGLVDSITTFDALVSKLESAGAKQGGTPDLSGQPRPFRASATSLAVDAALSAEGGIAFSENLLQSGANQSQGPAVKTALTDQQIAALAEGAALTGDTPAAETPATQTTEPAAETSAPATPEADAAQAATPVQADAVVTLLQAQLAQAQAQVVDLTVELRGVKAELDGAKAASAGFRSIAQASVDRMKVALGMPSGIAAATDEALMGEHTSLRSTFEAKFKAGGVAAVSAAAPTEGAPSQPDPARQARIHATRLK